MGSVIEIREGWLDFMPLNFPVEEIHLIVQLSVLFNACIKLGVVIDVFPYLVLHLQRIRAEDVLGYVLTHPESSVRDISKACFYSKSTVWNISPVVTYHHITYHLWSYGCQFSRQGSINTQNKHYWSLENPHLIRPNRHQVRWSVNVGCGIWKSPLIGPLYFDGPLTSESYTEILSGPFEIVGSVTNSSEAASKCDINLHSRDTCVPVTLVSMIKLRFGVSERQADVSWTHLSGCQLSFGTHGLTCSFQSNDHATRKNRLSPKTVSVGCGGCCRHALPERKERCQSLRQVGLLHDRWLHHLSTPPQFWHELEGREIF
ncbi:uncharacterized protein TNCV_4589061 [Trichonephila clavipes]|nr:uncharacterized protein TNCV_4589061 [Trichonephila clavipes]